MPDMLAITLLAIAAFMVIVLRLSVRRRTADSSSPEVAELTAGFVYVGAGVLALLGLVVIGVGRFNATFAANLAMISLFGGCVYLLAAFWLVRRR